MKRILLLVVITGLITCWTENQAEAQVRDFFYQKPAASVQTVPPIFYQPMYTQTPIVFAPYGPEHVRYTFRHKERRNTMKYHADTPRGHGYDVRARFKPSRFGSRYVERFGR